MNILHAENPLKIFQDWLNEAKKTEINDPEAMALATCNNNGIPSVRMVLLKEADEKGFKFHTNAQSHKGNDLLENPIAALCFHWKSLRKQIRITGRVERVSDAEADEYFANRPYNRQIGAHASLQSRPLESREFLESRIKELQKTYPQGSSIPRPAYWVGYRVIPQSYEFWWDNEDRLHDRLLFTLNNKGNWEYTRLYP